MIVLSTRMTGPRRSGISSGKATLCPVAFGKSIVTTMCFFCGRHVSHFIGGGLVKSDGSASF